jgi:hypothetical protein
VQADNAAWREAHLSPLQHQAALWESQGRPDSLLLRDEALEEAERWLTDHYGELMPAERDFVAACREAAERHALEAQAQYVGQLRKFRRLAMGEALGFGLAIISLVVALVGGSVRAQSASAVADRVEDIGCCLFFPFLLAGIVFAVWTIGASVRLSRVERREKRRDGRKRRLAFWRKGEEEG